MNPVYRFVKNNKISKNTFLSFWVILFLTCYFFIFAIYGRNGMYDMMSLHHQIEQKKITEQSLSAIRKAKESKVNKMRPESLDFDLLDEEVRKNLSYVEEDEIVIYDEKE